MKTTQEVPMPGTTTQELPPLRHTHLYAEGKTLDIAKFLIQMSQQARVHADTYLVDLIDNGMARKMGYFLGTGRPGIEIVTVAAYPE